MLVEDALIDLRSPLWVRLLGRLSFIAVLLGRSDSINLPLAPLRDPVRFLSSDSYDSYSSGLGVAQWCRRHAADMVYSGSFDVLSPNRLAVQNH